MKVLEIIADIKNNGGLDMNHIRRTAKKEGTTPYEYVRSWAIANYNCSGATARRVATHYTK